ncbi:dsRBD fold-containing protein [Kitasatospora griseola]|uniref:dsRBD fold-containing protein n=1 Tax=Kitasatospora griseola TaxID=2064 RepID=UPI00380375ED
MTENTAPGQPHTKQWTLRLDLFEENDTTKVHAVLDTGDNRLESRAVSHRNPHDRQVPEIGDEYAAGRALIELGRRLIGSGRADAAANEPALHG